MINNNFLIGPGDDDYGRKKPFWKVKQEVMEKIEKQTEKCVLCGVDTKVPVNENIENRAFYVEGAGQLCESCYNKVYGARITNP